MSSRLARNARRVADHWFPNRRRRRPVSGWQRVYELSQARDVDLILDIGANGGQFARDQRNRGYRRRMVSFEPQPAVFADLSQASTGDGLWEVRQLALGAENTVLPMHLSGLNSSSSFFEVAPELLEQFPQCTMSGTVDVPVARLDSLADELRIREHRALIKIDVQGFEAEVLKGAAGVLGSIDVAFVELCFAQLYHGQCTYYDVMKALEDGGLRFVGLFDNYADPKSGFVLWADGLFVRHRILPS